MNCPANMLEAMHICDSCISNLPDENLKNFANEIQSFIDKIDLRAEEIEKKAGKENFEGFIKNMDLEKLEKFEGGISKPEELARMINESVFNGDWEKQIEWIEKYGSQEQKEDIPLIKRLMKENI